MNVYSFVASAVIVAMCLYVLWMLRQTPKRLKERIHDGSPFHGWTKISLMGRTELVGAAREVRDGKQSYLEVLTLDGRAIRTQYSAIYSIERVPFGRIEDYAERQEHDRQMRARLEADASDRAFERNNECREQLKAARATIIEAHGHAEDYFDDGENAQPADVHLKACRDVLAKAIETDDEHDRLPF